MLGDSDQIGQSVGIHGCVLQRIVQMSLCFLEQALLHLRHCKAV
jgi:hypothetical protein